MEPLKILSNNDVVWDQEHPDRTTLATSLLIDWENDENGVFDDSFKHAIKRRLEKSSSNSMEQVVTTLSPIQLMLPRAEESRNFLIGTVGSVCDCLSPNQHCPEMDEPFDLDHDKEKSNLSPSIPIPVPSLNEKRRRLSDHVINNRNQVGDEDNGAIEPEIFDFEF